MRRAAIDAQNEFMLRRQRELRLSADIVAKAWAAFPEVEAIALIGSLAKPLWKEVPRFREFRSRGIEIWHEPGDVDLALWLDRRDRLGEIRRATALALRRAFEQGVGVSVAPQQLDVFLFEPLSDRYLGRLCSYSTCPKGKIECLAPGCGAIAFAKQVQGFRPGPSLLANQARLFRRGEGFLRSALDLPTVEKDAGESRGPGPAAPISSPAAGSPGRPAPRRRR